MKITRKRYGTSVYIKILYESFNNRANSENLETTHNFSYEYELRISKIRGIRIIAKYKREEKKKNVVV